MQVSDGYFGIRHRCKYDNPVCTKVRKCCSKGKVRPDYELVMSCIRSSCHELCGRMDVVKIGSRIQVINCWINAVLLSLTTSLIVRMSGVVTRTSTNFLYSGMCQMLQCHAACALSINFTRDFEILSLRQSVTNSNLLGEYWWKLIPGLD
jgi:hypothetical protein